MAPSKPLRAEQYEAQLRHFLCRVKQILERIEKDDLVLNQRDSNIKEFARHVKDMNARYEVLRRRRNNVTLDGPRAGRALRLLNQSQGARLRAEDVVPEAYALCIKARVIFDGLQRHKPVR